jgi:hypothetical protein
MDGTFRDYVTYEVPNPHPLGGPPKRIREATWTPGEEDDGDKATFNRAERIHQIPAGDPDYIACYPWRADSESINRGIDDFLYLRRAQSLGAQRQLFDLWCHAFMINSYTRHRYAQQATAPPLDQAA